MQEFESSGTSKQSVTRLPLAFISGAAVGTLGGLVGLGGAEFRLPLLISLFHLAGLQAVIINKAMSLLVVAFGLPFRASTIPLSAVAAEWPIIVNLLAGSLAGAWLGATWATRLSSSALYRVIAVLLIGIALVLATGHDQHTSEPLLTGTAQMVAGVVAGFGIGVVASVLGVAGGELLIPTLVLLFGMNIKLAGSLSFAVSIPTMIVGFTRYSQDQSFGVLRNNPGFVATMAAGSIVGSFIGAQLLGFVRPEFLLPMLAAILVISAVKVWRHSR